MKHVNIKIYGAVQGVWFRQNTKEKALELGLAGWVRNEPDGMVYIETEGEEEHLKDFINWCSRGPRGSKVKKIEHEYSKDLKNFESFIIRY